MENLKGKPLVSVIVPIYNAEQYLTACVDALLAQTYTHIEILLVDDGSKDRSGILCDEYAQRDSRVRVLHLQNGGVSRARNHALEVMKGEWVCFADADDEVTPYYVEHFVDAMEEGIDVIISEVIFVHEEGRNERLSYKRHGTLPLTEIFSINELSAKDGLCVSIKKSGTPLAINCGTSTNCPLASKMSIYKVESLVSNSFFPERVETSTSENPLGYPFIRIYRLSACLFCSTMSLLHPNSTPTDKTSINKCV